MGNCLLWSTTEDPDSTVKVAPTTTHNAILLDNFLRLDLSILNWSLLFTLIYLGGEGNVLFNCSKHKRLQKVMILYRLIWARDGTLLAVADLVSFPAGS